MMVKVDWFSRNIDDDGRVIGTRPHSDEADAAPAIGNVTGAQHVPPRPSQLHRFLNRIGGHTRSVNDYSRGTSMVMQPYVVGKQGDLTLRARPVS
jgi:hypothetical protein